MGNPLINFRCNPELLEMIADIGKQLYPKNNANGYDQSKTILHLLEVGIKSVDDCKTITHDGKTVPNGDKTIANGGSSSELKNQLKQLSEAVEALRTEFDGKLEAMGKL